MSSDPASVPAYRSRSAWIVLLTVVVVGLGIDLGSKAWAFANVASQPIDVAAELAADSTWDVPPHAGIEAIPFDLLQFKLVINRGAVFGFGKNMRFFFILFTIGALGAGIYVFSRWLAANHRLAQIAMGLIFAGGIGNLYDRLQFGVVRDFLRMLPNWDLPFGWSWPGGSSEIFPWVFNGADTMLIGGMVMLMLHVHMSERRKKADEADAAS